MVYVTKVVRFERKSFAIRLMVRMKFVPPCVRVSSSLELLHFVCPSFAIYSGKMLGLIYGSQGESFPAKSRLISSRKMESLPGSLIWTSCR